MKRTFSVILTVIFLMVAILLLAYLFRPFADRYLYAGRPVGGDYLMHLSNIKYFWEFHTFPIKAWQTAWFAGYPVVEGYPWLNNYLIQPLVSYLNDPAKAMEYHSIASLFLYIVVAFFLFLYASRNKFLALLLAIILLFGADASMTLFIGGFFVFVANQFFLPLILLLVMVARDKQSTKLWVITSLILSFSFCAHTTMVGILVIPAILPYLIFDQKGKISGKSLVNTLRFFFIFGLLSLLPIYQYLDQALRGISLSGVKPTPLAGLSERFAFMFSWQNPILLLLLAIMIPVFFIRLKRDWSKLAPPFFSFILIAFIFLLMVLQITPLVLVLMAERGIWAVSLTFLVLFAVVFGGLAQGNKSRWLVGGVSLVAIVGYIYLIQLAQLPFLIPRVLKEQPLGANVPTTKADSLIAEHRRHFTYLPLSWNQAFDNYRTDSLEYTIFHWWNLVSPNSHFKGWFPAMKGLSLDWSGLVMAAERGMLGEEGALDDSQEALNQTRFFLDWYGIRHLQIRAGRKHKLADYLKEPPLIKDVESVAGLIYYNLDPNLIGPLYSPTNAKTLAVVAPEKQYDNFIRMLAYTGLSSQKIIPLYLGDSLGALRKTELGNYDSIFLYGYKASLLKPKVWSWLSEYVKNGGNLFIETGQKVKETEALNLPEVFPVSATLMEAINKPWEVEIEKNILTKKINQEDFTPLNYKYLPFAISKASAQSLKSWAKPTLKKGEEIVLAYGTLGEGKVVWSGLNLPFQAVDTRNVSETVILGNIFNWFFPKFLPALTDFEVSHPQPEEINVSGSKAKGILIKEHFNPGWQAQIDGKKAKIYKAGLLLMYIPLGEQSERFNLRLIYNGAPIHWILFALSLSIFLGVITYLFLGGKILNLLLNRVSKFSEEEEY